MFSFLCKTIHFGIDSKTRDLPYFRVEDFGRFFCVLWDHIEMPCKKNDLVPLLWWYYQSVDLTLSCCQVYQRNVGKSLVHGV